MTIPSTKASTTHVDSPTDRVRLARADIKQNIDNVNEIIDHLNNEGTGARISLVPFQTPPTSISIGDNDLSVQTDAVDNGDIDVTIANDEFAFTATGDYYVRFFGTGKCSAANVTFKLKNKTDSSSLFLQDVDNDAGVGALEQMFKLKKLTVTDTAHKYKVTVESTSSSTTMTEATGAHIEFIKL